MHSQHSSGPPRELTPEELADRARRVARRQSRNQRRAERQRQAQDPDRPQGFLLRHADVIGSGLFGFIGLGILAAGCILLVPAISAAQGHGIPGVFVAEQYVSGGGRYESGYWLGTFKASDRRLVVQNVDYNEPPSALRAGRELAALYPGGSEVFAPHDSSAWFGDLILTLIGAGFFGWWVWYMPLRPLRRRRRLRLQTAADPLGALLAVKRPAWPWARQRSYPRQEQEQD